MKKLKSLLLLFIVSTTSFAIEISSTSASQVIGGFNVNVRTYSSVGTRFLSNDFSIENNIINLTTCFSETGTLGQSNLSIDFFIPLTNSGNYTVNVDLILSSFMSTICDSTVVTDSDSTEATYASMSINDFDALEKNHLSIFPNPASTKINLDLETIHYNEIYLLDSFGRIITRIDNFNQKNVQLDLSDLNSGIYFVAIETDNRIFNRKILKK